MSDTGKIDIKFSPWLGLASYSEQNAETFWGRSAETESLFYKIYDNIVSIVYGPSGVGKSSLLRAGVFPKLRGKKFFPVYLRFAHSRSDLSYREQTITAIRTELEKAFCTIEEIAPLPEGADENLWSWLHRHKFSDVLDVPIRPVLFFDQFEELFTISEKDENEIQEIITQICDVAGDHLPSDLEAVLNKNNQPLPFPAAAEYRIVLSLRDDFISYIDDISVQCPALRNNRIPVKPMKIENAREVVYNDQTRCIVNQVVAEKMIQAVSENSFGRNKANSFIEPALLSLFCEQINLCRIRHNMPEITEVLVEENKGNILNNFYNNAMQQISISSCEKLEDNLVSESGFRLLKAVDDLLQLGIKKSEIDKIVNSRLLRSDIRNGVRYVELCHDIILPVVKKKRGIRILNKKMRFYRKCGCITAGIFAFILSMLLLGYCLFFKEYKYYYKHYVKVYGIPVGKYKLSEKQVKQRCSSYELRTMGLYDFRFNYWKNFRWNDISSYIPFEPALPYRLTIVNNEMQPTTQDNMFFGTYIWTNNDSSQGTNLNIEPEEMKSVVIIDFVYENSPESDGNAPGKRPRAEIGKNSRGEIVWVCRYMENYSDDNYIYDKQQNDENTDAQKSDIFAKQGAGQQNFSAETNSASAGIPSGNSKSANTNVTASATANKQQLATIPKCDATVFFTDKYGFPVKFKDGGTAPYVGINYNKSGHEEEWIWIDPQKRDFTTGLDKAHKRVLTYNDAGLCVSMESYKRDFTNNSWEKINDAAGNHKLTFEYNETGDIKQGKYYDKNGEPISINGYCYVDFTYDQFGNQIEVRYLNKDREDTCDTTSGFYLIKSEVQNGKLEKIICYSLPDHGVWKNKNIMKLERVYNAAGKVIQETYFDKNGKPTPDQDNIARIVRTYTQRGEKLTDSYFDKNGKPTVNQNGVSHREYEYDQTTQKLKKDILYSLEGHGIWGNKKVMKVVREYNPAGKITEESYFDKNGKPTPDQDNIARIVRTYTQRGEQLTESYFDKNGKPTVNRNGVWHAEYEYDQTTQKLKKAVWHSLDGHGVGGNKKIMKVVRECNSAGKVIKESGFDKNGKPTVNQNGVWHAEYEYDQTTQKLKKDILYSLQGYGIGGNKTVVKVERKYNATEKITEESYWDKDNNLTPYQDNIARIVRTYTQRGEQLTESYFDKDGKKTVYQNSVWRMECEYDQTTNKLKKAVLHSLEGHGIGGYKNIMKFERVYNAAGKVIKDTFFDKDGKKTVNQNGVWRMEFEYDQTTHKLKKEVLHSLEGHGIWGYKNIMKLERVYNAAGKVIKDTFFDKDGKKTVNQNGVSHWEYEYDQTTQKLKKDILYSLQGYGVWGYKKVMKVVREYNSAGKITKQTFFDKNGKPTVNLNGVWHAEYEYDQTTNKLKKGVLHSLEGHGVWGYKKVMKVVREYNPAGKVIKKTFFDKDGKKISVK